MSLSFVMTKNGGVDVSRPGGPWEIIVTLHYPSVRSMEIRLGMYHCDCLDTKTSDLCAGGCSTVRKLCHAYLVEWIESNYPMWKED